MGSGPFGPASSIVLLPTPPQAKCVEQYRIEIRLLLGPKVARWCFRTWWYQIHQAQAEFVKPSPVELAGMFLYIGHI